MHTKECIKAIAFIYAKGIWHSKNALKYGSYCARIKNKLQLLLVKTIEFQGNNNQNEHVLFGEGKNSAWWKLFYYCHVLILSFDSSQIDMFKCLVTVCGSLVSLYSIQN